MRTLLSILSALLLTTAAFSQQVIADSTIFSKETASKPDFSIEYTSGLSMDVYLPAASDSLRYCIIHAYGGGFIHNNQKIAYTKDYCRRLADDGYVAIAIDYRLGLTGIKMKSKLQMVKPLINSIHIATEDMLRATAFVLNHADEWRIRKDGIVLSGSSAGAIMALQSDYEFSNGTEISKVLPEDFRYAGIIAFAGAVLSDKGKCKYPLHSPAPTLMLHGTVDKLVTYDKIAICNIRFSGANDLVKSFVDNQYAFDLVRYSGEGHGVARRALVSYPEVTWFLNNMVKTRRFYQIDKTVWDREYKVPSWDKIDPKKMY